MTSPTLSALLLQQDQATIYNAELAIATTLGLPVTSWQPGDPTRSLFFVEAVLIEALEVVVTGFIQSGFLDFAQGQWLVLRALEDFNVVVPDATFATTNVTLTNGGGGVYIIAPGDLVFKASASGATYHNTTGGTLSGTPATLSLAVIADVAGSGSNASVGGIDTLVTTLLGVTCSNPANAVGTDQQSPATTIAQCRAKGASLSPNGPAAAYQFVALTPALTGVQTITRARVYSASSTGFVTVYVAGAGGAVGGSDVTAVQAAINTWATPLCITATVNNSNNVVVPVTYTVWVYQSVGQTTAQIQAAILLALQNYFAARPIGGDIIPPATTGALYQAEIAAVIGSVFPGVTFRVSVSAPAGDTSMGNGDVAVLGTVTGTVNLVPGP